jgi:hypothetical protein
MARVGYPANTPSNRKVYNNTVDGNLRDSDKPDLNFLPKTLVGSEFINNIATTTKLTDPGLVAHHNYTGDAYYLERVNHNYQLRHYSPAVDAGVNLGSPYMDDPMLPIDTPDLGALEHGRTPWIAGATLRSQDLSGLDVTCKAEANGTTATCSIDNLPVGRRVPNDFQIKIGNGAPAQNCVNQMDYALHRAARRVSERLGLAASRSWFNLAAAMIDEQHDRSRPVGDDLSGSRLHRWRHTRHDHRPPI